MEDRERILILELKAYFQSHFCGNVTEGGCDTCGYGGNEGMDLEAICDLIDKFIKSK